MAGLSDGFYILIFLTVLISAIALLGLWLIFKVIKKSDGKEIKEIEIFADKSFEEYLNEENLQSQKMEETKFQKDDAGFGFRDEVNDFSESEILKLAKKYSVGQGEVELLLNLRSKKTMKNGDYERIISEIEKGLDMRKVAKKYRVGCGEVQLLLNLKNANQSIFWKKWK
jgi:competence protein ComGF